MTLWGNPKQRDRVAEYSKEIEDESDKVIFSHLRRNSIRNGGHFEHRCCSVFRIQLFKNSSTCINQMTEPLTLTVSRLKPSSIRLLRAPILPHTTSDVTTAYYNIAGGMHTSFSLVLNTPNRRPLPYFYFTGINCCLNAEEWRKLDIDMICDSSHKHKFS